MNVGSKYLGSNKMASFTKTDEKYKIVSIKSSTTVRTVI